MQGDKMIELYNPVAFVKEEMAVRAPLALKGKRIGMLNNSKPNVDLLFDYMAKWLPERFHTGSIVRSMKANAARPAAPDIIKSLGQDAEVVINAVGD